MLDFLQHFGAVYLCHMHKDANAHTGDTSQYCNNVPAQAEEKKPVGTQTWM